MSLPHWQAFLLRHSPVIGLLAIRLLITQLFHQG
jgi:hypothetical protein